MTDGRSSSSAPATPAPAATASRGRRTPRLVAPSRPARWLYALARMVIFRLCRVLWQVTIEGTCHIPRRGQVIVSPVHRSNIDTLLMSAVTTQRLSYLAKDSLWRWRPLGWLFSALGGFPVRRGLADREALRRCVQVLRSGQSLVVFPEGTRRSGPVVKDLFEGAAYLALRTGVPIVPVGIGGSEGALPRGRRLPRRTKVHMIVGEPIVPATPATTRVQRHQVHELTERLQGELQALFDRAQLAATETSTAPAPEHGGGTTPT